MCFQNGDEVVGSLRLWSSLFPDGAPDAYMPGEPSISRSLLLGKRARENITRQLEAMRNAESAPPPGSSQQEAPRQLLNAKKY